MSRRPVMDTPRHARLAVRLTAEELTAVDAARGDVSRSEWVRYVIAEKTEASRHDRSCRLVSKSKSSQISDADLNGGQHAAE